MGNIISKMGLYDLFARGMTGVIVLCAADLFGITNILDNEISAWAIILGGYFLGLVLEELSYLLEGILKSRQRAESKICAEIKYKSTTMKSARQRCLQTKKMLFQKNR